MATEIEEGSRVRQVVPVVEGVVVDVQYSKASKSLEYLVAYEDAEGETHERWFPAADIALVEEAE